MASLAATKAVPNLRTCDACKFKHQRCDGTKPVCRNCSVRRLKCNYSHASAAAVQRPERARGPPVGANWIEEDTPSFVHKSTFSDSAISMPSSRDNSVTAVNDLQTKVTQSLGLRPAKSEEIRRILVNTLLPGENVSSQSHPPTPSLAGNYIQTSLKHRVEALRSKGVGYPPGSSQELQNRQIHARPGRTESHHRYAINPFDFSTLAEVKELLVTFVERVNSIFRLFRKGELEYYLDMLGETTSSFPNQIMAELCLACALGAQTSTLENADKTIVWYENGRRYLDDEDWKSKLWVMRAMALISIYHMEERKETSSHYLSIALSIGREHRLSNIATDEQPMDQETSLWLPVWQTVNLLNSWHQISRQLDFKERAPLDLGTEVQREELSAAAVSNTPVVGIYLHVLVHILLHIIQDVYLAIETPWSKFENYMTELQIFVARLPGIFQYTTSTRVSERGNEERAVILHLHTLRLGTVMVLTRPMLLKRMDPSSPPLPRDRSTEFESEAFAYICIEAASDLVSLCEKNLRVESFPQRSWLPIYFLFEAALISILGVMWQTQLGESEANTSTNSPLLRAKYAVDMAGLILQHCATSNRVARDYWMELRQSQLWIESGQ